MRQHQGRRGGMSCPFCRDPIARFYYPVLVEENGSSPEASHVVIRAAFEVEEVPRAVTVNPRLVHSRLIMRDI
jgi:hypothetical protein